MISDSAADFNADVMSVLKMTNETLTWMDESSETTERSVRKRFRCSQNEKESKKAEKSSKKVLTFSCKNDNMNKLIRTAHAEETALNLENDTEQE